MVGSDSLHAVVVSSAIVWHADRLLVVVASLVHNVALMMLLFQFILVLLTFVFVFSLWFIINALVSVGFPMHCDYFPHKISV